MRRELSLWTKRARAIPDPDLRGDAISALTEKSLNAEATAVFAILTPRCRRADVARLMTAYQVMIDYLDTVSERPAADPLRNGLCLHRALADPLMAGLPPTDYYRHHLRNDDGGYLEHLVTACRERFHALPSAAVVRPMALRAAERCGEGQSHTHAAGHHGIALFAEWAARQERSAGYEWWEVAAGASSSVAVHALLAAAASSHTTAREAQLVDAAYFPPIGALTVLLDDLVDYAQDHATASHNYFAYYSTNLVAAERIADILTSAESATKVLRHHRTHAAILAGVIGFYLSAPEASAPYAQPIRARALSTTGGQVTPLLAAMRLRRALADRRHDRGDAA